jgi:hypothetical protein
MAAHNQAERIQLARLAAHTKWANCTDPTAATAPARTAFLDRFEKQVDPDGILTLEERARRAEHARKAYFQRLALASSKARAAKAGARRNGGGRGAA